MIVIDSHILIKSLECAFNSKRLGTHVYKLVLVFDFSQAHTHTQTQAIYDHFKRWSFIRTLVIH